MKSPSFGCLLLIGCFCLSGLAWYVGKAIFSICQPSLPLSLQAQGSRERERSEAAELPCLTGSLKYDRDLLTLGAREVSRKRKLSILYFLIKVYAAR